MAGMVSAMLTRASYSSRATGFQLLDWDRVSRTPRGLRPAPPEDRSADDAVPGFEKITLSGAFGLQHGQLPAQPGDKTRIRGVNSFAQMPAPGGKVR